jgi:hypothetical protein
VTFALGDWVWLRHQHRTPVSLHVGTSGKLRPRFFEPYNVVDVISPVAYKLELPPRACLHDVFHVGLLKPFKGTSPDAPPALAPVHHGLVVLEPERVVCARVTRGVRYLLVRWKGEPRASSLGRMRTASPRVSLTSSSSTSCSSRGERCHVGPQPLQL